MSVNLVKGQKVSLTKENVGAGSSLNNVIIGLGWDEAELPATGKIFFGRVDHYDFDCDAMAFLLDEYGRISAKRDIVFYNNLNHYSQCVHHKGDNLTGGGDGDDEQILVALNRLPNEYQRIVIVVSIYKADERNQHFGMINNAFVRIVNADTNRELCRFNLTDNYGGMKSLIFGELYRNNGEWKFNAIGQGLNVWSVSRIAERYGLPISSWR